MKDEDANEWMMIMWSIYMYDETWDLQMDGERRGGTGELLGTFIAGLSRWKYAISAVSHCSFHDCTMVLYSRGERYEPLRHFALMNT